VIRVVLPASIGSPASRRGPGFVRPSRVRTITPVLGFVSSHLNSPGPSVCSAISIFAISRQVADQERRFQMSSILESS
jgi:hypothetical protein